MMKLIKYDFIKSRAWYVITAAALLLIEAVFLLGYWTENDDLFSIGGVLFVIAGIFSLLALLIYSVQLYSEELTKKSAEMNEFVKKLAKERGLDTIDLFSPMAGLSRAEYWRDDYHFTAEAVNMQAEIIAGYVLEAVETVEGAAAHAATLTGPDGKVE